MEENEELRPVDRRAASYDHTRICNKYVVAEGLVVRRGSVVGGAGVRIRSSSANSSYGGADSNQGTGAQASGCTNASSGASTSTSSGSGSGSASSSRSWSGLSESLAGGEGQDSGGDSDFFHEGILFVK